MDYVIASHHVEPQAIVSIRDRCKQADLPQFFEAAFAELYGALGLLEISPAGMPFAIYHEFGTDGVDVEVCVPAVQAISPTGRVNSRELPSMTVARTLHVGRYEDLEPAYAAVTAWVTRNGFVPAGPVQERYLNGPGDQVSPSEYRTEIEIPVAPLAVGVPV